MECQDCGKPYMAGLEFVIEGNYLRCKKCHNEVVEERKKCGQHKKKKKSDIT